MNIILLSCLVVCTDLSSYVSSLPASARPHLEPQLDWGHEGVEKDLSEIADHMLHWEEKLSTHLELTPLISMISKRTSRVKYFRGEYWIAAMALYDCSLCMQERGIEEVEEQARA